MKDSLAVELGRTVIDGNEVIIELGAITYTNDVFTGFDLNTALDIDIQFDNNNKIIAFLYINGSLTASCNLNSDENGNGVIIKKITDSPKNTIGLYEGQSIELNHNCANKRDIFDIVLNKERVVAHGKIIKDYDDSLYQIMVSE